jgi:hypothetical protein
VTATIASAHKPRSELVVAKAAARRVSDHDIQGKSREAWTNRVTATSQKLANGGPLRCSVFARWFWAAITNNPEAVVHELKRLTVDHQGEPPRSLRALR